MSVEVRLVVIKATVSQENTKGAASAPASGSSGNLEIIKTCVEKVLEIIKEKHGR